MPTIVEPTNGQEALHVGRSPPGLGLAGIGIAWAVWRPERSARAQAYARAIEPLPAVFEQKFGFDIAYDLLFYRPTAAPRLARRAVLGGPRHRRQHRARRHLRAGRRAGSRSCSPASSGPTPSRSRSESRRSPCGSSARASRERRRDAQLDSPRSCGWCRSRPRSSSGCCPLDRRVGCTLGLGALAFLIARPGPSPPSASTPAGGVQFQQYHSWVPDIGLGYHVGLDGLSLVLCGADRVRAMWCLAFGLWAGREQPRRTWRSRCCSSRR